MTSKLSGPVGQRCVCGNDNWAWDVAQVIYVCRVCREGYWSERNKAIRAARPSEEE